MKIYGYTEKELNAKNPIPSELVEITLVANPKELRLIAKFLENSAQEIEENGTQWAHEHLSDKFPQFTGSPHFVVFNPDVEE